LATWTIANAPLQQGIDYLNDYIQVNIASMDLSANHRITQIVEIVSEFENFQ
jgi:ATP-dependent RNA helicase DDX5/DBP2